MRLALVAAALVLWGNTAAFALCGQAIYSGWYAMPPGPGASVPLSDLNTLYNCAGCGLAQVGSFNNTVPPGSTFYLRQMLFQTKGFQDKEMLLAPNGSQYQVEKNHNSYFVLGGVFTLTSQQEAITFDPPIPIQSGYVFGGNGSALINQANDAPGGNNMIAMINGFYRDSTCPYPQPVQGISPGY